MRHLLPSLILVLVSTAIAQPAGAPRVLKNFDFEERRLGNQEDLPMHWVKVHGPGLPHYVNGRLTRDRHRGGEYSFRFDLNGGSLIYRFEAGRIKAERGAHYHIEGYCQTTVLAHARARMTAYFADAAGRLLPQTIRHSDLYAADREDAPWKRLSVDLTADMPAADSIVIELELLQPMLYRDAPPADPTLFDQDIYGSAWWDDISVCQVPRIALRTERPGNIFRHGDPLRMDLLVSDRALSDLIARLTVVDGDGREQFKWEGALDGPAVDKIGDGQFRLRLDLPPLPAGWYRAEVAVSSQRLPLATEQLKLVVLPEGGPAARPDERFELVATSLPFQSWDALPEVLPFLSAGRVKLAVWSADGDVDESNPGGFDRLLLALRRLGITPTGCLLEPPPEMARKSGRRGWAKLLEGQTSDWQPALALLLARHATQVNSWQIGADGSDEFARSPVMREAYPRVYGGFSRLLDKPELTIPWPAGHEPVPDLPASIVLTVPATILPSEIPAYVQAVRKHPDLSPRNPQGALTIFLPPAELRQSDRQEQARNLTQRIVYALAAGADRIDLPLPLDAHHGAGETTVEPRGLFPVVRTVLSMLSGARYTGRVAVADGIEAFQFDRGGEAMLVMWDTRDRPDTRELPLNFGERAAGVDLWGNSAPLTRPADTRKGGVLLRVGRDPIFLADIDAAQSVTVTKLPSPSDNFPAR